MNKTILFGLTSTILIFSVGSIVLGHYTFAEINNKQSSTLLKDGDKSTNQYIKEKTKNVVTEAKKEIKKSVKKEVKKDVKKEVKKEIKKIDKTKKGNNSIIEDKKTVIKANAMFDLGDIAGWCERDYNSEPSWQDISTYKVTNGNIELDKNFLVPDELKSWQNDSAKHKEIWSYFSKILPPQYLNEVSRFTIFSDGLEWNTLDVWPHKETKKWEFVIDISDIYCRGTLNVQGLQRTSIHEFGHMITLDPSQIDVDYDLADIFFRGHDMREYKKIFVEKSKNCNQTFMTHSGCSKDDSYINSFVKQFKIGKFSESVNYNAAYYSNEWNNKLSNAYTKEKSSFVTEYAASDAHEDMAESWTAFVLKEKPEPKTIAGKKILFFYNYPELVKIRSFIRSNL